MKIPKSLNLQIIIPGLFLFLPFGLTAQTITFSGEITKDTIWSADTVLVTGSITVNDNVTLTIEPGTYVQFQGWYKIDVQGTIIAEGLPGDTIVFTCHPDSTVSGWDGLEFFDQQGYMIDNDSSRFSYCRFEYGREKDSIYTTDGGGAILVYGFSRLSITNSSFINNYSAGFGGSIYCWDQADIIISSSSFIKNHSGAAYCGSAIYMYNSDPLVVNNYIINNNSSAVACNYGSEPLILNNIFGQSKDKAIHCYFSDPFITGNIVINNQTAINADQSSPTVVNNTICNNATGIYCYGNTKPVFYNNIIWGNDVQVYIGSAESQPDFFYCDIQGGSGSFSGSYPFTGIDENNLDLNPQFQSPSTGSGSINFDPDADWSIQVISPCLNSGTPDISGLNLYPSDILGNPRILYNRIDQGAIEYHLDTITVCGSVSADTVWFTDTIKVDCDLTIQDNKILTILPGTVIEFLGYYKINVEGTIIAEGTEQDTILFTIKDTIGFNNPEITNGGWGSIEFDNGSGIMSDNDSSIFRFCKFQYGKSVIAGHPGEYGGAIKSLQFSRIRIENCSFINNLSKADGGAVYFWLSDLILRNNYFENNTSGMWGGALRFYLGNHAEIDHNVFYRNHARQQYNGGAISLVGSGIVVENNIFSNNSAGEGGAIDIFQSENGLIINNLICNNTASYYGGGIKYEMTTEFFFINNTIVNNKAIEGGGLNIKNGNPIIYNSQIWGNQTNQVNIGDLKGQPDIHFSNIQGGTEEFSGIDFLGNYSNNINSDPYFANPSQGAGDLYSGLSADWSLLPVSPSINHGISTIQGIELPDHDLKENPRIHSVAVDIGAFENQSGSPVITEQPLNFVKCVGDNVVFTAKTSKEAFFQWQKDGENIAGATENQYLIDSLTPGQEGNYQCMIWNAYDSIQSNSVFLGVKIPPEILSQTKNVWTEKDQPSSLKVFADGTNLKYQWQKNGMNLSGEVSPELIKSSTDYVNEGTYQCIISNSCGTDTTSPATLYVAPQICMVTVSTLTGNNLVVWEKNSIAPLTAFNIYRESTAAGIYDLMSTLPYNNLTVYEDTTADPTKRAYIYKITGIDSAGIETDINLCKPHKTIHLLVSTNPELKSTQLAWDKYYGFDYQTYNIYRSNTGANFSIIDAMPSTLSSWTDPEPITGELYYRVAVEKPTPCIPAGSGKKADSGPYSHSMSNMDDNRLQAGENPPDSLMLTNHYIDENNFIGKLIGRFMTIDPDTSDTFTYHLVSGDGDDDNLSFTLIGDLLVAADNYDYETKDQYSIRVRSTDKTGNTIEDTYIIYINDLAEPTGMNFPSGQQVMVYPNPLREESKLLFPNPEGHEYTLLLTNLSGKVVRRIEKISTPEYILEKGDLKEGLYFIELRGPKVFRGKIIVE